MRCFTRTAATELAWARNISYVSCWWHSQRSGAAQVLWRPEDGESQMPDTELYLHNWDLLLLWLDCDRALIFLLGVREHITYFWLCKNCQWRGVRCFRAILNIWEGLLRYFREALKFERDFRCFKETELLGLKFKDFESCNNLYLDIDINMRSWG